MGKRRHNPYTNAYVCSITPHKIRYLKAAFAWEVGAKQVKKQGRELFLYRCACKGWHLTKSPGPGSIRIETAAAPPVETDEELCTSQRSS